MNGFIVRASGAILAAIVGGLTLVGCSGSDQTAPAAPVRPTTLPPAAPVANPGPTSQPSTPTQSPAPRVAVLGPDGYGQLKLGMTKEHALATGELGRLGFDDPADPYTCAWYGLADHPARDSAWAVAISKEHGVVSIASLVGLRTPEGIEVGSTFDRVKAAYPGLTHYYQEDYFAPVPRNTTARYRLMIEANRVTKLGLEDLRQNCHE